MRPRWTGLRRTLIPAEVAAAVAAEDQDKLLALAPSETGTTIVAGRYRVHLVAPEESGVQRLRLSRPWHLVDAGSFDAEGRLRVVWVDAEPAVTLVLREPGMLPETLRERVQASVVYAETIELGPRRSARVVIRRELETGTLLSQAILGTGTRSTDPGVADGVRAGLARVREQVGLD